MSLLHFNTLTVEQKYSRKSDLELNLNFNVHARQLPTAHCDWQLFPLFCRLVINKPAALPSFQVAVCEINVGDELLCSL